MGKGKVERKSGIKREKVGVGRRDLCPLPTRYFSLQESTNSHAQVFISVRIFQLSSIEISSYIFNCETR